MRFAFILDHAAEFYITTMCRVLRVSKAGYYAWIHRPLSAHAVADEQLALAIAVIHETSRRTYSSPRVHEELKAQGQLHSVNRIARIMHEEGIQAKARRAFKSTTDSNHAHPIAPNTLDREFAITPEGARDRVWVGDISVPQKAA